MVVIQAAARAARVECSPLSLPPISFTCLDHPPGALTRWNISLSRTTSVNRRSHSNFEFFRFGSHRFNRTASAIGILQELRSAELLPQSQREDPQGAKPSTLQPLARDATSLPNQTSIAAAAFTPSKHKTARRRCTVTPLRAMVPSYVAIV